MLEVHPLGSSLSCQDRRRPGESCGCGLSCELGFYDLNNFLIVAQFALEKSRKAWLKFLSCIVALPQEGVPLIRTTELD